MATLVFGLRARTNTRGRFLFWAPHVPGSHIEASTRGSRDALAKRCEELLETPVDLVMGEGWHPLPAGFEHLDPFVELTAEERDERLAEARAVPRYQAQGLRVDVDVRRQVFADAVARRGSQAEIAERYGISQTLVSQIKRQVASTGRRYRIDELLELAHSAPTGDECVIWPHSHTQTTPMVTIRGRNVPARRAVLLETGPAPAGHFAHARPECHRSCIRHDHLEWRPEHPSRRR